jgi:hypothetical protein
MAHQQNVWGTKQDTSIANAVAESLPKHGGIMVAMAVAKGPEARPIRTRDGWTIELADQVYLTHDGYEYEPLALEFFVHAGDDVPWITDITDAVEVDTSAEDAKLAAEFDVVFNEITEVTGVYSIDKARAARLDRRESVSALTNGEIRICTANTVTS